MRLDSSGNLGLGVTPSGWYNPTSWRAAQIGTLGLFSNLSTNDARIMSNTYLNTGGSYIGLNSSQQATNYIQAAGQHQWHNTNNTNVTAGTAFTFTQAMTLDASGNLGVGTTSPRIVGGYISVGVNGVSGALVDLFANGTRIGGFGGDSAGVSIASITAIPLSFSTNNTERARIDSSGNLLVASTATAVARVVIGSVGGTGSQYFNCAGDIIGYGATAAGANTTDARVLLVQKISANGRSVNAAGTFNANGADYAEYMVKSGDFTIQKGDICGIDFNGMLTNVFSESVSFVVKSTDPSFVGGDSWRNEKDDPENAELVRATVDRIAFSGQVPVNVLGATPGDYIIPVEDSGSIKGEAVSNPTFEQYQKAVGKVIAIESDGRARIIVKVS